MNQIECDVAVIGAGTAGLAAERSARRNGATTLLIDENFSGTTCTNVGCMPSKLLIAAAAAAEASRRADIFGIKTTTVVDGAAVMHRVRQERDKFIAGIHEILAKIPDGVMCKSHATFEDALTLRINNGDTVKFKAAVIATGATPSIPEFLRGMEKALLTNETLFDLPDLPASIGIVGAGPLGLELAQALSRLGVAVTVFDQGPTLGALTDNLVSEKLQAILAWEFPIYLGVKLSARWDDKKIRIGWIGRSKGEESFDYILAAAGRPPHLEGLGLETTGLSLNDHGVPEVDPETLQCGSAPIFIAGDADHTRPVLHEAQSEGLIAGRNAARFPDVSPGKRMTPLSIMFSDPPTAVVGILPERDDPNIVCKCASYEDQGRAKVFATNNGVANIYAHRENGQLVAAAMVGPAMEHIAHLLAWAIQEGMTAHKILEMPFYHPTYEEGFKPALREICKAVNIRAPNDHDDGVMPGA